MRILRHVLCIAALCVMGTYAYALPSTFVQEGLVYNQNNQPLNGNHRIEVQLYTGERVGQRLFTEVHPDVAFVNGYYAISIGSETPMELEWFLDHDIYLAMKIDDQPWLEPRTHIQAVPIAMVAARSLDAVGDINPKTVTVNNRIVIDRCKIDAAIFCG